jgi:hypothetical protein
MRSFFAHLRPRLTFANVISVMALFVALGGSSYAVVQLSKGQVKTKHIAKNAVTTGKVKDGSLLGKDFKAGELPPAGPQGPQGDTGAQGLKGDTGAQGTPGQNGASNVVVRRGGGQGLFNNYALNFKIPFDLTASCLAGERATGGGFKMSGNIVADDIKVDGPEPAGEATTPTAWRVTGFMRTTTATNAGSGVHPYVVCASP